MTSPTESTQKSSTTILWVHPGENSPKRQHCLKNPGELTVAIFGQKLFREWVIHRGSLCCSDFLQISSPTTPPCPTTSTNPKRIPIKRGDLTFHFHSGGIGSSRLLPPSSPVLAKALCLRDEGTKRVFLKAIGVFKWKPLPVLPLCEHEFHHIRQATWGKRRKTGTELLTINRWMDLTALAIPKISVLIWSPYYSTRKKQSQLWDGRSRK